MPLPMVMWSIVTPWIAAKAERNSWDSGSP